MAAERHHPALVGLLQQLGRVLGRLGGESVVVGGVEALAREQCPRHRHQRSHLRLAVGKLVFVQDERLPSVTDRTGRRLVPRVGLGTFSRRTSRGLVLLLIC